MYLIPLRVKFSSLYVHVSLGTILNWAAMISLTLGFWPWMWLFCIHAMKCLIKLTGVLKHINYEDYIEPRSSWETIVLRLSVCLEFPSAMTLKWHNIVAYVCPHDTLFAVMTNIMTYVWCHDKLFDVLKFPWHNDKQYDVMMNFLTSWWTVLCHDVFLTSERTFWRPDVLLMSWHTFWHPDKLFWCDDKVFDLMANFLTYLWRHDTFFDVMTYYWTRDTLRRQR